MDAVVFLKTVRGGETGFRQVRAVMGATFGQPLQPHWTQLYRGIDPSSFRLTCRTAPGTKPIVIAAAMPYPLIFSSLRRQAKGIRRFSRSKLHSPSGLMKSVIAGALRTNWRSELM